MMLPADGRSFVRILFSELAGSEALFDGRDDEAADVVRRVSDGPRTQRGNAGAISVAGFLPARAELRRDEPGFVGEDHRLDSVA